MFFCSIGIHWYKRDKKRKVYNFQCSENILCRLSGCETKLAFANIAGSGLGFADLLAAVEEVARKRLVERSRSRPFVC